MAKPHYNNLKTYKAYLEQQRKNLSIIAELENNAEK